MNSSHERADDNVENNVTFQRCLYAYEYVQPFIAGKKVLDVGCGLAYGTALMAPHTTDITGVDYSEETVSNNKARYTDIQNLTFVQGEVPPLNFPDNTFDVVTAFQFIEHIHQRPAFIKEVARVLKPGGVMFVTTPNIKKSLARNPFHVHEYTFDEMKKEVSAVYEQFELKGLIGNEKVNTYYQENGKFVRSILKWDILGLHKILPAKLLALPYNLITNYMRKDLMTKVSTTTDITVKDFSLTSNDLDTTLDIYVIATKK